MLTGALTLIDDDGEHAMLPGDCASFPAGEANGHHLKNTTEAPATFLVVGTRTPTETAYYSDMDMKVEMDATGASFTRKDGSPLPADEIGGERGVSLRFPRTQMASQQSPGMFPAKP